MSGRATPAGPHPVQFAELVDYWFGELDAEAEAAIEEHLFECSACAAELDVLVGTGQALVAGMRRGAIAVGGTTALGNRLARDRRNLRQYVLHAGEVVPCAVSADDELVLTHLVLPEPAPGRLDLIVRDERGQELMRVDDVTIDRRAGRVSRLLPALPVRAEPSHRRQLVLLAPTSSEAGERVVGTYTLEHTAMNES